MFFVGVECVTLEAGFAGKRWFFSGAKIEAGEAGEDGDEDGLAS